MTGDPIVHDMLVRRLWELGDWKQVVEMSANVAFLHAAQRHRADVPKTLSAMEAELAKERATLPD